MMLLEEVVENVEAGLGGELVARIEDEEDIRGCENRNGRGPTIMAATKDAMPPLK